MKRTILDLPLSQWGTICDYLNCVKASIPSARIIEKNCPVSSNSALPDPLNMKCSAQTTPPNGPADCSSLDETVAVDKAANQTMLSTALNEVYSCWTRTDKAGFVVYKRQIEKYLWDPIKVTAVGQSLRDLCNRAQTKGFKLLPRSWTDTTTTALHSSRNSSLTRLAHGERYASF